MNSSIVAEKGGQRAWSVVIGERTFWVAKSLRGQVLGRLFATKEQALAACEALDKHLAQLDDLLTEQWQPTVLELSGEKRAIVFWNTENDTFYEMAQYSDPNNQKAIEALQEALKIMTESAPAAQPQSP